MSRPKLKVSLADYEKTTKTSEKAKIPFMIPWAPAATLADKLLGMAWSGNLVTAG